MSHTRKTQRGQPRRVGKGYMNKMVKAKNKRIHRHPTLKQKPIRTG